MIEPHIHISKSGIALDRRMDKENMAHLHNGVLHKNDILKFAGKWMELANIILNEVTPDPERQLSCGLTHKWCLNIKQREPAYKSQSQRT